MAPNAALSIFADLQPNSWSNRLGLKTKFVEQIKSYRTVDIWLKFNKNYGNLQRLMEFGCFFHFPLFIISPPLPHYSWSEAKQIFWHTIDPNANRRGSFLLIHYSWAMMRWYTFPCPFGRAGALRATASDNNSIVTFYFSYFFLNKIKTFQWMNVIAFSFLKEILGNYLPIYCQMN